MRDIGIADDTLADEEAKQEELNDSIDSDGKLESADRPHPANEQNSIHIEESWDGDKTSPPGTALLAAFQQVTSSMPWIPFQNDNSPIA